MAGRVGRRAAVALVAMCALAMGCARQGKAEAWYGRTRAIEQLDWDADEVVEVRQAAGGVVHWVLPGQRALSAREFGSPASPRLTVSIPPETPEVQRDLVHAYPYLIGVPPSDREVTGDGLRYTVTGGATPFGDEAIPVSGRFSMVAHDRRRGDRDAFFDTPDEAELSVRFRDPDGARYEVVLKQVVEAPVPGWETDGGVLLDGQVGGDSGSDSPLAPRTYAYAALWGIADVVVNGEVLEQDKLVRVLTGETVRDRDYRLVQSWELPLALDRTPAKRPHQTSVVVWPVRLTPVGPVHEPLELPYLDGQGQPQPFIHVVFEENEIVRGPEFPTGRRPGIGQEVAER